MHCWNGNTEAIEENHAPCPAFACCRQPRDRAYYATSNKPRRTRRFDQASDRMKTTGTPGQSLGTRLERASTTSCSGRLNLRATQTPRYANELDEQLSWYIYLDWRIHSQSGQVSGEDCQSHVSTCRIVSMCYYAGLTVPKKILLTAALSITRDNSGEC